MQLAGLEHLDERYVKAVGYATKAKRHGRPKMVLIGDIVGESDDAVAAAAAEVVRIANVARRRGLRRRVGGRAPQVLARPRAHRGDRAPHQRVQDQRGRRHSARRASATTPMASSGSTSSCRSPTSSRSATRSARSSPDRPSLSLWGPDDDARPAPELLEAKIDEARALVAATRARWQDLLDRIDATFPALQDRSRVVSWKAELRAPLAEIFAGLAFAPVLARCDAIHAEVLQSRVFVALHMHAGDGNVHTNIPVNSDDYAMLRKANAAVARIMALARRLDGVISGEHGIGITKLEYLTADEIAPFAHTSTASIRDGRFNAGKLLRGREARQRVHAELLADRPREPDPRGVRDRRRSPTRSRTACAAASASRCARRTCRAPTCSIRRATRSSRRRC